jgi:hypothetical protein
MNEFEDFTIGKVSMIMDDIMNGEADKEDAQQLLNYIAYLKKNNLPIPKMLDDFYKESHEQFLLQNKSYAQSIGLKKSRGRPNAKHELILLVADVLENILEYKLKEEAIRITSRKFYKAPSSIKEIFDKYKHDALHVVKLKIVLNGFSLEVFDFSLLDKYF